MLHTSKFPKFLEVATSADDKKHHNNTSKLNKQIQYHYKIVQNKRHKTQKYWKEGLKCITCCLTAERHAASWCSAAIEYLKNKKQQTNQKIKT